MFRVNPFNTPLPEMHDWVDTPSKRAREERQESIREKVGVIEQGLAQCNLKLEILAHIGLCEMGESLRRSICDGDGIEGYILDATQTDLNKLDAELTDFDEALLNAQREGGELLTALLRASPQLRNAIQEELARIANDPHYGLKGGCKLTPNNHVSIFAESALEALANALGYFAGGAAQQAIENKICENYGVLGYDTRLLGELANRFLQHATRFLFRDVFIPLIKEKCGYLTQVRTPSETRNFWTRLINYAISIMFDFFGTLLLWVLPGPGTKTKLPLPVYNGQVGTVFAVTDFFSLVANRYMRAALGWKWEPKKGTIDEIRFSAFTRVLIVGVDMVAVTGIKNWLPGRNPDNKCEPGVSSDSNELQKIVAVIDLTEAAIGMASAQLSPVGTGVSGGLPGDRASNRATASIPNSVSPFPRRQRDSMEHRLGESLPSRNFGLNNARPVLRPRNVRPASQGLFGTNRIRQLHGDELDPNHENNLLHAGQSNLQLVPAHQENVDIEHGKRFGMIESSLAESRQEERAVSYNVSVGPGQDVQSDKEIMLLRKTRVSNQGVAGMIRPLNVDTNSFDSPRTGNFPKGRRSSSRLNATGLENPEVGSESVERIDFIDSRLGESRSVSQTSNSDSPDQHQDDQAEAHAHPVDTNNSDTGLLSKIILDGIPRSVPRGDRKTAPEDFEKHLHPSRRDRRSGQI